MFFGVVLAPGKAFSSTLQHDLMLSSVAIGRTGKKGERSVLELTVEGHKFVVATLRYGEVDQASIDLHFVAGTSVQLSNPTGTADLHVVGNYIIENDFDMDSDEDGDDEIDSDEFGSEDSDLEISDDEDDDEDDDDDDSDEEPPAKRPASKAAPVNDAKRRTDQQKPAAAPQKPAESKTPQKPAADAKAPAKADAKTPSKDNKTPVKPAADSKTPVKAAADSKTPVKADSKTPVKTDSRTPVKPAADSKTPVKDDAPKPTADTPVKHPSGLRYIVLKAAPKAAPVAKKGRTVVVSYRGTLNQGGKQFDASKRFEFRLGAGDVIQGWDIGVAGMQVGEKRRLLVPPALGYGKEGAKERGVYVIPRNASLDFDVELLQIK